MVAVFSWRDPLSLGLASLFKTDRQVTRLDINAGRASLTEPAAVTDQALVVPAG